MRTLSLMLRAYLGITLLLCFGVTAMAQGRHGDTGEYQILQARYGTAAQNVDVTQRLRELARADREFQVSNATFGVDPQPYQKKMLRIYARGRDGQTRTFEYQEEQRVDGAMFTGWGGGQWGRGDWRGGWEGDSPASMDGAPRLMIIRASYGTQGHQRDVTQRLRELVRDGRLDITADNNLVGEDPAPYATKTLWISFSVGGGTPREVSVEERQRLSIP